MKPLIVEFSKQRKPPSKMSLNQILLFVSLFDLSTQQVNNAPSFIRHMRGLSIPENTPVGRSIYRLEASDPQNQSLTYRIGSFPVDIFEIKNSADGIVYLKKPLNYETQKSITVLVNAMAGERQAQKEVVVNVSDMNDEIPSFDRENYDATVVENAPINTVVWTDLTVTDPDSTNQRLEVICDSRLTQGQDICQRFILETKERSNAIWRGNVILKMSLNYARKSVYEMPLRAWDGVNEARKIFTIRIADIQDKPPVFTSSLLAIVSETISVGSVVITVKAEDGDRGNPRPVRYELTRDIGDFFSIDTITGAISTNKKLDREESQLSDGYHSLQVTAREVIDNNILGNDRTTSTRVTVTITVLDVNDNAPKFQQSQYETYIREDAAIGYPLINMAVSDDDMGKNAEFSLYLLQYRDVFELFPAQGTGRTSVQLRVKNNENIDYDKGIRQYIIPVVAMETKSGQNKTGETQVIVNVQDIDDNVPKFTQASFTSSVSEMAVHGTPVITLTANDDDISESAGINLVSYFLLGNGADKFRVEPKTGLVTVASCPTPGKDNCIDYETLQQYQLIFAASVNAGEATTVTVPLTINVIDSNDVTPQFTADQYVGFINEGEQAPSPTLQLTAVDSDSSLSDNDRVSYSILSSNPSGLFVIGQSTGVITAIKPVQYNDTPNKRGIFTLTVQASDGLNKATTSVSISVIDRNDHVPKFRLGGSVGSHVKFLPETAKPGTSVILAEAVDDDPASSSNGQLTYHIESGSRDKFIINPDTGMITVADGATFDYDQIKRYQLKVIATDKGQPQFSGVTYVVINIQNKNNKSPYFPSPVIRADIFEDKPVGSVVTALQAMDPDADAQLSYSIQEPKRAWDPRGREVDAGTFDFKELFSVEQMTGIVRVKQTFQREKAAVVSVTITVVDIFGSSQQSGTATLLVTILNVNDKPPVFASPWSLMMPSYNISVKEEQLPGAFVMVIVASDPDGSISRYEVKDDPSRFFTIDALTGVVSLQKPIDYETTTKKQFTVVAYDNGEPQLSSSAKIFVSVENVNDETPKFSKDAYTVTIPEKLPEGTIVSTVLATDGDQGTFGIVRYTLQDIGDRFNINPTSGLITVKQGAALDREISPVIVFTVTAQDSPERPEFRRSNTVPVYVTLSDKNDNSPTFAWSSYDAVIVENSRVGSPVVQLSATDRDAGDNAKLMYYKISGDPNNYFSVNELTGQVTVNQTLIGKADTYSVVIGARDQPVNSANSKTSKVTMTVKVISVNNAAPVWLIPAQNNQTIDVLENQYSGMIITKVEARDTSQADGQVTYGLLHDNQFTQEMPGFGINPFTGIIRARATFDREIKDTYSLMLVARDNGNPPFESTRSLTIKILDVDDHLPEFPAFYNCCNIPYNLSIQENSLGRVGIVKAVDKDIGQYASVTYKIIGGNINNEFAINDTTGEIKAIKPLDRETQSVYSLTVEAKDGSTKSGSEVATRPAWCACQETPSVVTVKVIVEDVNDNVPVFPGQDMLACISLRAPVGHMVTQVTATDRDSGLNSRLTFSAESVTNVNEYGDQKTHLPEEIFLVSRNNGSVYVNSPLVQFERNYFLVNINAEDGRGSRTSAVLRIWVTKPSQLLVATVSQDIVAAKRDISNLKLLLSKLSGGGLVYVQQIRYHVAQNGIINPARTDMLFYVIRDKVLDVYAARRASAIMWGFKGDAYSAVTYKNEVAAAGLMAVKPVYNSFLGFWIDPVLVAVIIILVLLFIMLLILCCVCMCIHRGYKKQLKRIRYDENRTLVVSTGRINPLWKEKLYDEHASVDTYDNAAFEEDTHTERMEVDENIASAAAVAAATTSSLSISRQTQAADKMSGSSDRVDSTGITAASTSSSAGVGGASLVIRPAENVTTETRIERDYHMSYEHKKIDTLKVDNTDNADVESALAGFMDFTSEFGGVSEFAASAHGGRGPVSEVGLSSGVANSGESSLAVTSADANINTSHFNANDDSEYRIETSLSEQPPMPRIEVQVPCEEMPPHRKPNYSIHTTIPDRPRSLDMASNLSGSSVNERSQLSVDTGMHVAAAAAAGMQYFGRAPVLYVDQHTLPPDYSDVHVQGQPTSTYQAANTYQSGSVIGVTVEQAVYAAQVGAPSGRRPGGAAAYIQQRYGSTSADYGSLRDPDPNMFRQQAPRFLKRGQVQNVSYSEYRSPPQSPSSSGRLMQYSERERASYDTLMYDTLPAQRNTSQYKDADIHIIAPANTIPPALASPGGSIQQQHRLQQSQTTQQQHQQQLRMPSPHLIVTSDREPGAYGANMDVASSTMQPIVPPMNQQVNYSEHRYEERQTVNNDFNW